MSASPAGSPRGIRRCVAARAVDGGGAAPRRQRRRPASAAPRRRHDRRRARRRRADRRRLRRRRCATRACSTRSSTSWRRRRDRTRGRRPVHILQIGDSHTAGDTITGGWRDILQARYGSGGRGVLAPGRPYQGYLTRWVTAEMSPGWKVASLFGAGSAPPRPLMGVAGFSITSTARRRADGADGGRQRGVRPLHRVRRRRAGCRRADDPDRRAERADDARFSPSARPECKTVTTDQPQIRVELATDGGPVTITSWATFRDPGGVVLSNVGVVGSQLVHFARNDDAVLAEELRSYRPDLIVLAFGTNEGFAPVFRPQEYEITLRTQIGRLRRIAGNVPILLFGAPDAMTPPARAAGQRARCRRPRPAPSRLAAPAPRARAAVAPAAAGGAPAARAADGVAGVMAALRAEGGRPRSGRVARRRRAAAPAPAAPPPPRRSRRAMGGAGESAVPAGRAGRGARRAAPCRGLAQPRLLGLGGADGRALRRGEVRQGRAAADARRLCPLQLGRRARDRRRGCRRISTARWRRGGEAVSAAAPSVPLVLSEGLSLAKARLEGRMSRRVLRDAVSPGSRLLRLSGEAMQAGARQAPR